MPITLLVTYISSPPGWYPNPDNPEEHRYWDGCAWTERTVAYATLAPPGLYADPVQQAALAHVKEPYRTFGSERVSRRWDGYRWNEMPYHLYIQHGRPLTSKTEVGVTVVLFIVGAFLATFAVAFFA